MGFLLGVSAAQLVARLPTRLVWDGDNLILCNPCRRRQAMHYAGEDFWPHRITGILKMHFCFGP